MARPTAKTARGAPARRGGAPLRLLAAEPSRPEEVQAAWRAVVDALAEMAVARFLAEESDDDTESAGSEDPGGGLRAVQH